MNFTLPEILIILSLIVSLFFIVIGVGLIITRVFKFTSELLNLIQRDKYKDADQIKNEALHEAKEIIEDANLTSLETIKTSTEKVKEIIEDTQEAREDLNESLIKISEDLLNAHTDKINTLSATLLSKYEEQLLKEISVFEETFSNYMKKMSQHTVSSIDSLNGELSTSIQKAISSLNNDIMTKFTLVDNEVSSYKDMKIAKLEEAIPLIIRDIATEILGKDMPYNVSEEYIKQIVATKFEQIN